MIVLLDVEDEIEYVFVDEGLVHVVLKPAEDGGCFLDEFYERNEKHPERQSALILLGFLDLIVACLYFR